MDQGRLFRLMPEAITITLTHGGADEWSLLIIDRPAGVPWADLKQDRYDGISGSEAMDVICAHLSDLA